MVILGIDPGTARMGYSVIETQGKKMTLVETSTIITVPEMEMHKRLRVLFNSLNDIAKKHSPDVMVIEKIFFNTNAKTAMGVGQARGISLLVAANKKMEVFEYTALQAKLILTGYGRSDKKEMQTAVMKIFKLNNVVKSDDANDAVAIAVCHIKKHLS